MAYKITAKHLGLEDDALIEISAGIVAIPNGGSVTLNADQENAFFTKYGEYPDTYFARKDSGIFKCTVLKEKTKTSEEQRDEALAALAKSKSESVVDVTDESKGGEA